MFKQLTFTFDILNQKNSQVIFYTSGNVTCSAYPIEQLDTINSSTGELNLRSALNLIVFGVRIKENASSGNRTRAARVAGEHSTTEPTMLDI